MTEHLYKAATALGLLAMGWVASGYLQGNLLAHAPAMAMTLLIAAAFAAGAVELHRFRQDTAVLRLALVGLNTGLHTGLHSPPAATEALGHWLAQVPAPLRHAVRLRVEGERAGLPGPTLTPYLVGLLVLLGMLGTFLGMVVTLNGTGVALENATDVQTMRDSLAAPVRGLGLAFGTSVAGVAASAMLGLMSALSRHSRVQAGQLLDTHVASTLQPFTRGHQQALQREQALQLQQQQAQHLPALVTQLQALATQLDQQQRQSAEQLLAGQQHLLKEVGESYRALATSVDQTLQRSLAQSLAESSRMAAETLQPAVQATLAGITRETAALHGHIANTVQLQLDGFAQRFEDRTGAWVDTLGQQLATQDTQRLARDNAMLDERNRLMATLNTLLGAVQHAATAQQAAIATLVSSTAAWLDQAGAQFTQKVDAESARMENMAAQLSGSAADVASLGDAFGTAVALFTQSTGQAVAQLQRVEEALAKSAARSDDQLAYCVAQARELIDLSLLAQKQTVDELQRLARQQAVLATAAAAA